MKTAALLLCPMLVAGIDYRALQDHTQQDWEAKSDWRCGHAPPVGEAPKFRDVYRPQAGIAELRGGSLDYLRETSTGNPVSKARGWGSLFCSSYLSRYKNPTSGSFPGVCVRDADPARAWNEIVQTDDEVVQTWNHFATTEGFQKSIGIHKETPADDPTLKWGSGNVGSVPNNWCGEYMKEMLCHIAFPQFADTRASALPTNTNANNRGLGARIRPVSDSFCESVMDICNRREPKPFSNHPLDWLVGTYAEVEQDIKNELWCQSWNSGYNISKAAPGVGGGEDSDDKDFVAEWEASSSLTPVALFGLIATLLVICL